MDEHIEVDNELLGEQISLDARLLVVYAVIRMISVFPEKSNHS